MHTSEKCRRGKQQITHRESDRKREREGEGGERERETPQDQPYSNTFFLFCVNTEDIAGEGEKEDKRQHKYDASQK